MKLASMGKALSIGANILRLLFMVTAVPYCERWLGVQIDLLVACPLY